MPATKAKSKQKRTLLPKKNCTGCTMLQEQVLDLTGELHLDGQYISDLAHKANDMGNELESQHAMLDVMAKALEKANKDFEAIDTRRGDLFDECADLHVQLARKSSVIEAYKRAWVKNQPYSQGLSEWGR